MSEVLQRTRAEVEALAASLFDPTTNGEYGLEVFYPEDAELFIDLDVKYEPARIGFGVRKLLNEGVISSLRGNGSTLCDVLATKSRNGNMHIYCRLRDDATGGRIPLDAAQRIALQAALGSDPLREALGIPAAHDGRGGEPTCMFETRAEAEKVHAWRERRDDDEQEAA